MIGVLTSACAAAGLIALTWVVFRILERMEKLELRPTYRDRFSAIERSIVRVCGAVGHDYQEVERWEAGFKHWGHEWHEAAVLVVCIRCGDDEVFSPDQWDGRNDEKEKD